MLRSETPANTAETASPLLQTEVRGSSASTSGTREKPLRLLAVISIVFFNVSGGPLGSEESVSALGPPLAMGMLVGFALIFSIPQAMITAELSTAFPCNGGYSIWVQAAFGTFWGVQESYWSWFSGVVDSAIYPVLLYSTGSQLLTGLGIDVLPDSAGTCNATSGAEAGDDAGDDDSMRNLWFCMFEPGSGCATEYGIKLAILALFCLPNAVSSRVVGDFLTVLCIIAMVPFLVIVGFSVPRWEARNFLRAPATRDWSRGFTTVYWNLSGFDSASTFAGEVDEPHKTFPRALFLSVGFIVVMYILPLAASAGADPGWNCWVEGSLSTVALLVGGQWLGVWVMITSAMSNWGLFASELLEDSYQLLGMAEMGLAPRVFARRCACTDTPLHAIALQFVMIALLISLDFNQILCIDNFFSAAAAALEFAACVRLRFTRPDLERPYRIPLGKWALCVMLLVPFTLALFVCYATVVESIASMAVIAIGLAIGLLLYLPFMTGAREHQSVEALSRTASHVTPNPVQGALLKRASSAVSAPSASEPQ